MIICTDENERYMECFTTLSAARESWLLSYSERPEAVVFEEREDNPTTTLVFLVDETGDREQIGYLLLRTPHEYITHL